MSRHAWLVPVIALSVAACGEQPAGPSNTLTPADAQFLAEAIDASGESVLDGLFLAGGPAAAPAAAILSSSSTITFERTRDCVEGGTLTLAGTLDRAWDGATQAYDVEGSGTKTRVDCAFARNDVVFTLNGVTNWTHERHYLMGARSGVWMTTWEGGFDWSKSTGESGSCTLDLARVFDVETRTLTLDGHFCATEIHNSRTFGPSPQ